MTLPSTSDFSRSHFILAICSLLACLVAYPLWQAFQTGGYIFYTNGVDESSYLSYPFSLSQARGGLLRPTSWAVVALHEMGLSGGYINLLCDITTTLLLVIGLNRLFLRLSFSESDARRGAVLAFTFPLLLTPCNPLVQMASSLVADSTLSTWVLISPRPELLFLRTPEPQISLTAIVLLLAFIPINRWTLPISLSLAPLLYSIIRTPYLLACLSLIGPRKMPWSLRVLFSLLATSGLVTAYWWSGAHATYHRFSVDSRIPLIPLSGVVSLIFYVAIREKLPRQARAVMAPLVASTLLAPNLQIVTGWFIGPQKYEEYWGVVVFGLAAAVAILQCSRLKNIYVLVGLALYFQQSVAVFEFNRSIFQKLDNPRDVVQQLSYSASAVALNDIYLASHLDLVHPKQPLTISPSVEPTNRPPPQTSTATFVQRRRFQTSTQKKFQIHFVLHLMH